MNLRALGILFASTVLAVGCGSDSAPPQEQTPKALVAGAATSTFATQPAAISLTVAGRDEYTGRGLVELAAGRFRVVASRHAPPSAPLFRRRAVVIGLQGEGFENTVSETHDSSIGRRGQRCWFNPHAPVGFYGDPISVEESMRVTGSVIESLRNEVASARETATDGSYAIELRPSASRPQDDFRDTARRVWGDRDLLALRGARIRVAVAGGRVARVDLRLPGYRPPPGFALSNRRRPSTVSIDARITETDRQLVIDPPDCQAIE